jgi:hypothetical protein
VLGHLDDIASDLSAIHGIRDMTQLSGPAFFALAFRLGAYESVMRARFVAQQQASAPAQQQGPVAPARSAPQPERTEVPATKVALQADPVMSGLISFGGGKQAAAKPQQPDLRESAMREYPELRPPKPQT